MNRTLRTLMTILLNAVKRLSTNQLIKQFNITELYLTDIDYIQIPIHSGPDIYCNLYIAPDNTLILECDNFKTDLGDVIDTKASVPIYHELMNSNIIKSYI